MAHLPASQTIRINNQSFAISELSEFGFTADSNFPSEANSGRLSLGLIEIQADFHTRHKSQDKSYCAFSNLTPDERAQINRFLVDSAPVVENQNKNVYPPTTHSSIVRHSPKTNPAQPKSDARSPALSVKPDVAKPDAPKADAPKPDAPKPDVAKPDVAKPDVAKPDVAKPDVKRSEPVSTGLVSNTNPRQDSPVMHDTEPTVANSTSPRTTRMKRLLLILPWLLVAGLLANKFWPTDRDSIAVHPSAQGEITQVLVGNGDKIEKGDLLLQLSQQPPESQVADLAGQLELSAANLLAAQKSLKAHQQKMALIESKREMDLRAAEAELESAAEAQVVAQATVDRIRPFMKSGAVSKIEFERIEMTLLAANAASLEKANLVENLQFAIKAAKSKILVEANDVSDKLAQLEIQLEQAQAKHKHLENLVQSKRTGATLSIYAPCGGEVCSVQKKVGDFVQTDDQVLLLKQAP